MKFYSTVKLSINHASEEEAIIHLKTFAEATRAEAGNILFEVLRTKEDVSTFIIWEIFKDKAALETHLASNHLKTFMELGYFIIKTMEECEVV